LRAFIFNLVLAVVWCLLWGSGSIWNFIGGLVVGSVVVSGFNRATGREPYLARLGRFLRFAMYFTKILIKSNLQVAREVITPGFTMKPSILRYPIDHLSPIEKLTLANAITLTPGTLSVDISPDAKWLYLHCMYAESHDAALADIDELANELRKGVFS